MSSLSFNDEYFFFNGKDYRIRKYFSKILYDVGEACTDIKKSEEIGYRTLTKEGKIIIYKYIYNKYRISIDSLMNLDNNCYLKSKYYSIVKSNDDLRLVCKFRKLGII